MTPEQPRQRQLAAVPPGSRLEELLGRYEMEKAAAEESASRFKDLTDAIKAEARAMYPGATALSLAGGPGLPVLGLTWIESWRFDAKQLKADDPHTYVRYAVKGGKWELRKL